MSDRPGAFPVEAVAFDLMDTLVHDPYREALAAAFGDRLQAAFAGRDKQTWPRFETGELTEDEFWASHAAWSPDLDAFHRVRRDRTVWLEGTRELLVDLRRARVRIVVATNYPSWVVDLEQRLLSGLVDEVVASYRVGVRKPDPRFYEVVAEAAGVAPPRTLFVDDRADNVEGARATGLQAIQFVDASGVREALTSRGVDV